MGFPFYQIPDSPPWLWFAVFACSLAGAWALWVTNRTLNRD